MKKKTTQPKKRNLMQLPAQKSTSLSLRDLQVPVEPLLTREQEWSAGRKVRAALSRLAEFLPRHRLGYRRYLSRMARVIDGGGLMFSWLSLRERIASDFESASKAYEEAKLYATSDPDRATAAYERGVAVLKTYPLNPETLFRWSKEVEEAEMPGDDLAKLPRLVQIERVLRKSLRTLSESRDTLVLPNLRLVLKDVFRYHPQGMRHSDLFQEGVLGLHKAIFRYDPGRGTRFSTYATYWIRQSIRKALIDKSRMIRVPQAVQEELRKEEPSLRPGEAARVRRIMSDTMLFSSGESNDGGDRSAFVVSDPGNSMLGEVLHTQTIPGVVLEAIDRLDGRSREIILRRFGIGDSEPQTLEQIGKILGLSRERIRQIERDALQQMQHSPDLQDIYDDLGSVQPVGSTRN